MNTEHSKHPFETVEASADVMKLAKMILSDCGQSTVISDSLQRRVAGRIQQHMDSALVGQQQAVAVPDSTYERKRFAKWFCMQDALKEDDASMDGYWAGWLARSGQPPAVPDGYALVPIKPTDLMLDAAVNAGDEPGSDYYTIYAAMLAAAPQAAQPAQLPPYNVFSNDDGDSWETHPASDNFVHGLQLGEEFELLAGWQAERVTFRVTKVPDDESDDYEVEEVTAPAAAQKGGAA